MTLVWIMTRILNGVIFGCLTLVGIAIIASVWDTPPDQYMALVFAAIASVIASVITEFATRNVEKNNEPR